MIFFLICLSLTNAIFAGIDFSQNERLFSIKIFLTALILVIIFYFANLLFSGYIIYSIVWGIVFIISGFSYLGILPFKLTYPLSLYSSLLLLLAAGFLSGFKMNFLIILLFVYFLTMIFTLYGFRFFQKRVKSSENVKELLELNQVLYGIFYFIYGIILATNRVEFLKRIAEILFN